MSFGRGAVSIKRAANQGGQQPQPTQVEFYSLWLALNFDKIIHSQGIVPQLDADEKLVDQDDGRDRRGTASGRRSSCNANESKCPAEWIGLNPHAVTMCGLTTALDFACASRTAASSALVHEQT